MQQLALAFRKLFRTPVVTGVAVLSLALGIGANAAIYSMFHQIMLRPLPVRDADQLVNLQAPGPKPGSTSCNQGGSCEIVFSYPMFRDLERLQTTFTGLAAHVSFGVSVAYENQPVTGQGMYVSGSYFPTLGIRPAIGRLLGPDDDRSIGTGFVAVLSHDYWSSHLGSDPAALGRPIKVNGQTLTIVGVAPRDFFGVTLGTRPKVFVPISMRGVVSVGFRGFENRRNYWVYVFARMKPGTTLPRAAAAINAVYGPIINDVEAPLQVEMSEQTMARFRAKQVVLEPGRRGQSSLPDQARTPLLMLFAVTGIVLLIACANIANLLLARGANRSMEMGVRLALGAGRRHLIVQLLVEAVVLALMGGIASLVVAQWTLNGIAALLPPDANETLQFTLQPAVLWFAAGLAIVTGLVFGLFPAWHSTRAELVATIRAGAGQLAGAKSAARFRASLVTAQIALATALLIFAGLFLKSLVNVTRVDLGIQVDQLVTFRIAPLRVGYDSTQAMLLYQRVEDELAAIPGVDGVTSAQVELLAGSNWGTGVDVQGFQSGPDVDNDSRYNQIGSGYFAALGARPIAGREFTAADRRGAPQVAIVNQRFTRKFNLGSDAVGKFMSTEGPDSMNIQIVGVVADIKYSEVKDETPPVFYLPWRQQTRASVMSFYVRSGRPDALLRTIPGVIKQIDAGLPVEDLKTMPQQVRENVFLDRMISTLSGAFAVLATLLASIGLYGVLAYSVAQRTREIGVRMALGADARRVRVMVLRQVTVMMLVGAAIGLVGALGLGRAGRSILYGLQEHDPVVLGMSIVLLILVALGAGYMPARRASEVDPVQALRYE